MKLLIEKGADVNAVDMWEYTPYEYAIEKGKMVFYEKLSIFQNEFVLLSYLSTHRQTGHRQRSKGS